ncbi:GNAT family N-acetyltransferase [uncultured Methylovirgula sp.]|uniref:GNAT family N-acetyltransferase n=1 Tax=uncultured Methylovirgula sp. TaxID=1285960 RepID=UPI002635A654|nr:GNAT family N-acetyltransferase [uncultured Methylovirgula sp.]
MDIVYAFEPDLSAEEFRDVLVASTLSARRPAKDLGRLERMLRQANIVATARDGAKLVGISRAITDFSYCCYLSDLAVDAAYQRRGIGRRLIEATQAQAGPQTTLILLSAPAAESYYPKIGMKRHESCWIIPRTV